MTSENNSSMFQLLKDGFNRYFSDPQIIILGFFLVVGFALLYLLGGILTPVLISIVIAYLLEGLVTGLRRLKTPRMLAVTIVFLLFLASLLVLLIFLLPRITGQIGQFLQALPSMLNEGRKELMALPARYPDFISESQLNRILEMIGTELTRTGQHLLSISMASVRGLITAVVYLVLVPLMVFFFLKDKHKILEWVTGYLPAHRRLSTEVWREVNTQIANYVRGKIWEILIVWGISYATFKFLGLQFSMLASLLVGLSVLVPYIGVTLMVFPVGLFAYFQWGLNTEMAYILLAYAIIQLLDGNLLAPLLLSEVVNLHPVAIIVAVLIFGGMWGVWGLFFAIPLATLVHAVIKAWFSRFQRETEESGQAG
jgi:putative permease